MEKVCFDFLREGTSVSHTRELIFSWNRRNYALFGCRENRMRIHLFSSSKKPPREIKDHLFIIPFTHEIINIIADNCVFLFSFYIQYSNPNFPNVLYITLKEKKKAEHFIEYCTFLCHYKKTERLRACNHLPSNLFLLAILDIYIIKKRVKVIVLL